MDPLSSSVVKGDSASRRSTLVVALLILSLALVAVLAWQAHDTALSHRAAAESVLRDYAALAAREFVRRATAEIGFRGYYPRLNILRERAETPTPAEIERMIGAREDSVPPLARYCFRLQGEDLHVSGNGPDEATRLWLVETIGREAAAIESGRPFGSIHGLVNGSPQRAAFARSPDRSSIVGFGVDRDALVPRFRSLFEGEALLPKPLGGDGVTNSILTLSVVDEEGTRLFLGGQGHDPLLSATVPFGEEYSGVLDGMTVRIRIDPASVSGLVIGGLPYSRMPVLILLLTLTSGLVLTAILQLRRETALAAMRSEFVSRVSHELRTPLTQIRMFSETLLLGRVRSEEERRRSLEIINRESRRLGQLVENVLQLSRSDRGTMRLTMKQQEIGPILEDLMEGFDSLARDRSMRIALDLKDGVEARIDEGAFRQIILNLLDNALKYGPAGQLIRLGLDTDGSVVRVWVEDQGPGIPHKERDRIMRRFQRLARDEKAAVAGTGIGLAVVRDLATRHGGRVAIESGREERGARFVLELPAITRPHDRAAGS